MAAMALLALLIFVAFAVIGGLAVYLIIRNQSDGSPDGEPPRGFPRDD